MIILGIDPGSTRIGYGIIARNKNLELIDCGTMEISQKKFDAQILESAQKLSKIIKEYQPELAGIEKLYFSKNVKTGIAVSQTRGALILEMAKQNLPIKEFSPSEVKLAVTGYGLADKKAVSKMVGILLNIKDRRLSKYDDATDALAIAITTANNIKTWG